MKKINSAMMAGLALFWAGPALAQAVDASVAAPVTNENEGTASTSVGLVDPENPVLDDLDIKELRGGENLIVTNQTLTAITTGNVIDGNYTAGNVTLSDFALSNFNGLGNLMINTGAQVSMQGGINLTINVGP